MMTRRLFTLVSLVLATAALSATAREAKVVMTGVPESPDSGYVTVSLEPYANDQFDLPFETNLLKVNNVPFAIPDRADANHLFLKDIGWRNWAEDPSKYYSPYDRKPMKYDPHRAIVQIPVADYDGVYLLAAADDDPQYTNIVSLRIGVTDYSKQVTRYDVSTTVPRLSDDKAREPFVPVEGGRVFLVHLPIEEAFGQFFDNRLALDVDITKELRLAIRRPDPCRYQIRPLGLPSGVRIFGMTFKLAPIAMTVTATEPGHVFNEPETPTFGIDLHKTTRRRFGATRIEAIATDYYGNTTNVSVDVDLSDSRKNDVHADIEVPVANRGYHELVLRLMSGRTVLAARHTTFALLPPDTRKHRDESPFGTWDFCGGHFTVSDPDLTGPLYVKAGLRYGMFSFPKDVREKYGVLKGNDPKLKVAAITNLAARIKSDPSVKAPKRLMIFHETGLSGSHLMRPPDAFVDRPPYRFSEKEEERFKTLWDEAESMAKAIRQYLPGTEIYFGNGAPHLLEAFVSRKFPAELLGSRGNEAGTFMRMPETQPLDFISNNSGLWMDRQILDHYGYKDTPLRQCYEMCYPGTNPGNLSLRTQASYYVRHMMHSLAWRIPIIRACIITDVGNSYYFSNWGSSGLCFAKPRVSPKPSYVACATMTLMLDGAEFTRSVPTGSPVVYAMEFKKGFRNYVTCLWTPRGTRELTVAASGIDGDVVTDLMANETRLDGTHNTAVVTVSPSPVFLTTSKPIAAITPGKASLRARPAGESFLVAPLDSLDPWTVESGHSTELEIYNFTQPRRKGNFEYAVVPECEGETNALRVTPKLPVEGSKYLQMYSVLAHDKGIQIPGEPTGIGLMVNGNGGWGHVYFELEDASGQRWISIGAEQAGEPTRWMQDWLGKEEFDKLKSANLADWNTDDPWQRSAINFEGWRYLEFPLPGNYPGEGFHWPYSSQWRFSGDGVVKYPLTFKKLIVTMPEKIVHLTDYVAVPRKDIYLRDLTVTYEPPEEAFVAE